MGSTDRRAGPQHDDRFMRKLGGLGLDDDTVSLLIQKRRHNARQTEQGAPPLNLPPPPGRRKPAPKAAPAPAGGTPTLPNELAKRLAARRRPSPEEVARDLGDDQVDDQVAAPRVEVERDGDNRTWMVNGVAVVEMRHATDVPEGEGGDDQVAEWFRVNPWRLYLQGSYTAAYGDRDSALADILDVVGEHVSALSGGG